METSAGEAAENVGAALRFRVLWQFEPYMSIFVLFCFLRVWLREPWAFAFEPQFDIPFSPSVLS